MIKNKFYVGDRVTTKYAEQHKDGTVEKVSLLFYGYSYNVYLDDGIMLYDLREWDITPIIATKFKVGDRVLCDMNSERVPGTVNEVRYSHILSKDLYCVHLDPKNEADSKYNSFVTWEKYLTLIEEEKTMKTKFTKGDIKVGDTITVQHTGKVYDLYDNWGDLGVWYKTNNGDYFAAYEDIVKVEPREIRVGDTVKCKEYDNDTGIVRYIEGNDVAITFSNSLYLYHIDDLELVNKAS